MKIAVFPRLGALVLLVLALPAQADWMAEYGVLLGKYVTPSGVRYAAWKKNAADLEAIERVVNGIAGDKRSDLAFYLNAYNAWILREALARYPTRSIKDPLFTFFLTDRITVAGKKMSFNKLEKEVIRGKFKEPNIHFALNCASRSCPPLAAAPFRQNGLEGQLEPLARAFVNTENGVRLKKGRAELSKIFEWYQEDFGGQAGVLRFINARRPEQIPAASQIAYQSYDWKLNEAK